MPTKTTGKGPQVTSRVRYRVTNPDKPCPREHAAKGARPCCAALWVHTKRFLKSYKILRDYTHKTTKQILDLTVLLLVCDVLRCDYDRTQHTKRFSTKEQMGEIGPKSARLSCAVYPALEKRKRKLGVHVKIYLCMICDSVF